jgi:hypothetical protein
MTFAFSQTTESFTSQIPPEEVNLELISQILSDQNIEFEMDEDSIQVLKGLAFDVFITIDEEKNLIKLRTYLQLKDSVSEKQLNDIATKLNHETGPLKFTTTYYGGESPPHGYIDGDYYFFYQFGFSAESFMYLIRFFSLAFSNAIKSVNKNKKIADMLFEGQ